MGLQRVVGTVAQSSEPSRLRVRAGRVPETGRVDGRLRLGRGGARVPGLSLLLVRLVDDRRGRRRRGRVTERAGLGAGLLGPAGGGETVACGRLSLDLLRHRAVVTGNRIGRLFRGFRFAGLHDTR